MERRFIPTGVGNTSLPAIRLARFSVHPHGRGEHLLSNVATIFTPGSSPRAWGTLINCAPPRALLRFIPTGVGNTFLDQLRTVITSVHPHGRGEHANHRPFIPHKIGSSPRAWGTHSRHRFLWHPYRFIPTGVGNTPDPRVPVGSTPVHPHGRGEHERGKKWNQQNNGSSPRAWGTPRKGTFYTER